MFSHLAIDVDYMADPNGTRKKHALYVPGETLLTWVQAAASSTSASAAKVAGTGTRADPYRLGGHGSFVGAWKASSSRRDKEVYFRLAGRLIKKMADGQHGGFADGCYMCDDGFSGTDPTQGTIWNRKDGASYREFGKFIHAGEQVAPMEGVVWSQRMASSMRQILKGTARMTHEPKGVAPQLQKQGQKWTVDMNPDDAQRKAPTKIKDEGPKSVTAADTLSALPLLSVVMFIAEPMRNARAWLMGSMLLDLMGSEYSPVTVTQRDRNGLPTQARQGRHFTFQRAFVHPSRLDDAKWKNESNTANDNAPPAWVTAQSRGDRKTEAQMRKTGSAAVEGLYPPSPKWSGRSAKNIDVANDYIQQKELALTCHWLDMAFNLYMQSHTITARGIGNDVGVRRNALTAKFSGESAMNGFAADLERIIKIELLGRRAGSFDSPGVLFR